MSTTPSGYNIIAQSWSGNVRPWTALVYLGGALIPCAGPGKPTRVDGGVYVGRTGFCATQNGAIRGGVEIAQRHAAKMDAA